MKEEIYEGDLNVVNGDVYQYIEVKGDINAFDCKSVSIQFPRLKKVGGYLYLSSLTSIPKGFNQNNGFAIQKCRAALLAAFAAAGFSFADGILARIVSTRGPVSRVIIFGKEEVSYLITDGDAYSHGKTLAEARDGLLYKIGNRDKSAYKGWTLDRVVTKHEAIESYRIIIGACEGGVRAWMEQRETPESLTVAEIIKLTAGAYGADAFAGFFNNQTVAEAKP